MRHVRTAIKILRRDGIRALLTTTVHFVYTRYVQPLLPRTISVYNGVYVNTDRYIDKVLIGRDENEPDYESGLVSSIEKYVEEGDNVVIVGGGWGVTAVTAARKAGSTGNVTVYEGSKSQVNNVNRTTELNGVSDNVVAKHRIVGSEISLRGEACGATRLPPNELPQCDVLELDCEGAETEILENLTIRPRVIMVESHGMHGAPSAKVRELLEELSYSIREQRVADKSSENFCIENDIYAVTAIRT